jgi:hypothetical protein
LGVGLRSPISQLLTPISHQRVAHIPQIPLALLVLDLKVADGALQIGSPVMDEEEEIDLQNVVQSLE